MKHKMQISLYTLELTLAETKEVAVQTLQIYKR